MFAAALFVGYLLGVSWCGWKIAKRLLESSHPRTEASVLVVSSYVVGTSLVVFVSAALGGFGMAPIHQLSKATFLSCLAVVAGVVFLATKHHGSLTVVSGEALSNDRGPVSSKNVRQGIGLGLILAIVAVVFDFALSFSSAPNNWDAMTYHLFLPARWLQESTIFHVPTVFGDNAAAYAPQNGALLFASSMMILGSDAATNVLQLLALGSIASSVFFLAQQLGAQTLPASLVAALVLYLEPVRQQAFSANVDVWLSSFWLAALCILVLYLRSGVPSAICIAGLATGLVAGTKTLGLSLAVLLLATALVLVVIRRRPLHMFGFLIFSFLSGGFWYAKNLVFYQNPLFPLELELGPLEFGGAYKVDAMNAGEFHLATTDLVVRNVIGNFGFMTSALFVLGAAGLALHVLGRRLVGSQFETKDSIAVALFLLGALWSIWFAVGIPHNNQARFLLPGLFVLLPGVSLLLEDLFRLHKILGWSAILATLFALGFAADPVPGWRDRIEILAAAGVALGPALVLAACFFGMIGLLYLFHHSQAPPGASLLAGLIAIASLTVLTAVATENNEDSRSEVLKRSEFSGWAESALFLNDPGIPAATIAYSGANVPYILMGRRFRHRVVYVNTQGEPKDGFYEHWKRGDKKRFDYHKPGLYRGSDDQDVWLSHLAEARAQLLFLFAMHPSERTYLDSTENGFPVESTWAIEQPSRFEPTFMGQFNQVFPIKEP